jgi:uncharacterized protein
MMQPFTTEIIALFLILGSLAGFLAGIFGIGGGIILIPLFLWAFNVAGFAPEIIVHAAFGTSLAIIIPVSISSTIGHRKRGNVAWDQLAWLTVGSLAGVAFGSSMAAALPGQLLKGYFGLMQVAVGLKMFLYHPRLPPEETNSVPLGLLLLVGFVVGAFSSFFGVGGGIVAVPMMVILMRHPIHQAVGSSSALMVISSIFGTAAYIVHGWDLPVLPPFSVGFVNLLVATIISPLAMISARLGVKFASRLPHDKLMRVFAGFLILIGLQMASALL